MSVPTPTTVVPGFADAIGCAYRRDLDQLLVVDCGNNTIASVIVHAHTKTTVGTGYSGISDIALSSDGLHAYVTETGKLLRLPLTNLNHAAAAVIASGLGTNIGQLGLDEAHGFAYVVGDGSLKRINVLTSAVETLATGLSNTRGVLITADGRFAYVSRDAGEVRRIDLLTHTSTVVVSGLSGPRHMAFSDGSESVILFPVPNPAGRVMKLDLTTTPPSVSEIAGPTAPHPYALAVLSPEHILIVCAAEISEVSFTSGVYSAAGPILLGIGFVPVDSVHIVGGYADTSMDPTYFYQVRRCPFGGTLPLMINHDGARNKGANFYQILVTPSGGSPHLMTQAYTDYRWSAVLSHFEAVTTSPANGYYPVHAAGAIWLNYWLGMLFDSTGQPNVLNTIQVKLFTSQNAASEIGHATDPGRSATLMIDNTLPLAMINRIVHDGANVNTCGIVNSGSTNFTFDVTASAPRHLLAWSLNAYWGDNKSAPVASDNYSSHIGGGPVWTGISGSVVPSPAWNASVPKDPTSTHCGHLFALSAWDRVINGWSYVHGPATYHKTITIML
jgi:hypothetical protein